MKAIDVASLLEGMTLRIDRIAAAAIYVTLSSGVGMMITAVPPEEGHVCCPIEVHFPRAPGA